MNDQGRPAWSNRKPPTLGPATLAIADVDWKTPNISPWRWSGALFDVQAVSEGEARPNPAAMRKTGPSSGKLLRAKGNRKAPRLNVASPALTRRRSGTRPASERVPRACTQAADAPMKTKK